MGQGTNPPPITHGTANSSGTGYANQSPYRYVFEIRNLGNASSFRFGAETWDLPTTPASCAKVYWSYDAYGLNPKTGCWDKLSSMTKQALWVSGLGLCTHSHVGESLQNTKGYASIRVAARAYQTAELPGGTVQLPKSVAPCLTTYN